MIARDLWLELAVGTYGLDVSYERWKQWLRLHGPKAARAPWSWPRWYRSRVQAWIERDLLPPR